MIVPSCMHFFIIFAVVVALFYFLLRERPVFIVTIKNGKTVSTKGRISPAMLADFETAFGAVAEGEIRGVRSGDHLTLRFKGDWDDGLQQRLRNILGIHRR